MTLRLTDEQDRALTLLAEADGVSKQEAACRTIVDAAARRTDDAIHHVRLNVFSYSYKA